MSTTTETDALTVQIAEWFARHDILADDPRTPLVERILAARADDHTEAIIENRRRNDSA